MSKYSVIIDKEPELDYLYGDRAEWKDYVHENFDETFVLFGNSMFHDTKEATWYGLMDELLTDLDGYYTEEDIEKLIHPKTEEDKQFFSDFRGCIREWGEDNFRNVLSKYQSDEKNHVSYRNDEERIQVYLNQAYPEREYKIATIRGNVQSEWKDVLYDSKAVSEEEIECLSDYYWGNLAELYIEDEDHNLLWTSTVSLDKLWNAEAHKELKTFVEQNLGLEGEYLDYKIYNSETKMIPTEFRTEVELDEEDIER